MNWRPYLIGGIVSLGVTILGGIIVYYITAIRQPPDVEKLLYRLNPPVSFSKKDPCIFLQSIMVMNEGKASAEKVNISIRFKDAKIIRDSNVSFSSGPTAVFTENKVEQTGLDLNIPVFAPNEQVNLSFLVETAKNIYPPEIYIKSTKTIGSQELSDDEGKWKAERVSKNLPSALWIALVFQVALIMVIITRVAKRGNYSLNNTAFRLLHKGLYQEAKKLLENSILQNGGSAYELSNLAVCLALEGKFDLADGYIKTALYKPQGRHGLAVSLFNKSLVSMIKNQDIQDIRESLEIAVKKSKAIKDYIAKSDMIKERKEKTPELDKLFENAQEGFSAG